MTATERCVVWLVEHPKIRRALLVTTGVHMLCLWAVIAAPNAAAATGSALLDWTGLHDSDGVPLKDYFLSVVDTSEAMTNNGQHVSPIDPSTWMSWMNAATQAGLSHSIQAWCLTNEAAFLVGLFGFALWFLKFAMSSGWLVALAQIGRPVFAAVNMVVDQMWLGPLAAAVCACVAGFHWMHGRPARAWNLLGTAAALTALSWTIFKNPIDDLVSDHGLLGMARKTGFQIAQDARMGSYAPGRPLDAQLDAMLAQLVSSTARPSLQLMNFGVVVDNVGTCRHAWSKAIMTADGQGPEPATIMTSSGHGPGPAHAMKACGVPQALAHAQQLGANDLILGLFFIAMGFLIALFIWYVGISTLLLGAKATYYAIVVGPAFLAGMTGWQRAKNYAIRAGSQLGFHGVQMIIFTTFLAVTGVGMTWALTTHLLGPSKITVVPRLLLVGVGSIVATLMFHYVDKHFYTDSLGTILHHVHGAWQNTRGAVRDEYEDYAEAGRRAHGFLGRWRRSGRDDGSAAEDDGTLGSNAGEERSAAPGFDVVKSRPARGRAKETIACTAVKETAQETAVSEAATAAAEGTTVAAEGAAAVVAPEVAIPAAAVAATVQHVRKRGKRQRRKPPDDSRNDDPCDDAHNQGTPRWEAPEWKERAEAAQRRALDLWSGKEVGSVDDYLNAMRAEQSPDLAHPAVAPRPAKPQASRDVQPTGEKAPPIEDYQPDERLEFPPTPPRPKGDDST